MPRKFYETLKRYTLLYIVIFMSCAKYCNEKNGRKLKANVNIPCHR